MMPPTDEDKLRDLEKDFLTLQDYKRYFFKRKESIDQVYGLDEFISDIPEMLIAAQRRAIYAEEKLKEFEKRE